MPGTPEAVRHDLLGIGVPESQKTSSQRALRAIILGRPPLRVFADGKEGDELRALERTFWDMRLWFIKGADEDKLRQWARALVRADHTLSENAVGWMLQRS